MTALRRPLFEEDVSGWLSLRMGHIQLLDGFHSGLGQLHRGGGDISVKSLDSLTLPPPDLIKLDVESHERHVLLGAIQMLAQNRPYIIFEDLPPPSRSSSHHSSVISDLFLINYNCFEINTLPYQPILNTAY